MSVTKGKTEMKKFLFAIVTILASGFHVSAFSASITITTTAPQDTRLLAAFQDKIRPVDASGNPRTVTAADVKQWLIQDLQSVVQNYEVQQQIQTITATPFTPN